MNPDDRSDKQTFGGGGGVKLIFQVEHAHLHLNFRKTATPWGIITVFAYLPTAFCTIQHLKPGPTGSPTFAHSTNAHSDNCSHDNCSQDNCSPINAHSDNCSPRQLLTETIAHHDKNSLRQLLTRQMLTITDYNMNGMVVVNRRRRNKATWKKLIQLGLDRRLQHTTLNTEQNQLVIKVSADN